MKTNYSLVALLGIGLFFTSCMKEHVKPSNQITYEERFVGSFTGLDVSDAIDVDVTYSTNEESVFVETSSNLQEYILTDVVAGVLRIRVQNNVHIRWGAKIKVHVTTAYLDDIDISGASRVEFNNELSVPSFEMNCSGASTFEGRINTNYCNLDLSGASEVSIWGSTINADIKLSGASTLGDFGFSTDTLDIDLSGASNASLTVNNTMNIEASGASTFYYKGTGIIGNLNLSGASNVKKK